MPTPHDPTRPATTPSATRPGTTQVSGTDRVIRWIGWHLLELVGVGVPAALAMTVSPWWGALAVLVGGLWVTHEIRLTRRHRAALTAGITPDTISPGGSARDEEATAS